MNRRPSSAALQLPLSAIDVYLGGWDAVDVHAARAAGISDEQYDWLWPFTTPDSELRELWWAHRDSLLREADRRGISQPWAEQQLDEERD